MLHFFDKKCAFGEIKGANVDSEGHILVHRYDSEEKAVVSGIGAILQCAAVQCKGRMSYG